MAPTNDDDALKMWRCDCMGKNWVKHYIHIMRDKHYVFSEEPSSNSEVYYLYSRVKLCGLFTEILGVDLRIWVLLLGLYLFVDNNVSGSLFT